MNFTEVSVVIPTHNRVQSLKRLLSSIETQEWIPDEILVIDSSDLDISKELVNSSIPTRVVQTKASVCLQRNVGIEMAKGNYILLCDDDIELPKNYIKKTLNYLMKNPEKGVVTGLWKELNEQGDWVTEYPIRSLSSLLYSWLFGLSIWGSVSEVKTSIFARSTHAALIRYYKKKDNTLTNAGWPIVTESHFPVNSVAVTSLGSALIRKNWLEGIKFEEGLAPNGYGDNYGVCVQFPGTRPVNVLMDCIVKHHHILQNRMSQSEATFLRTLALHSFVAKHPNTTIKTSVYFYWSLIGLGTKSLLSGQVQLARVYAKVAWLAISRNNPYLAKK